MPGPVNLPPLAASAPPVYGEAALATQRATVADLDCLCDGSASPESRLIVLRDRAPGDSALWHLWEHVVQEARGFDGAAPELDHRSDRQWFTSVQTLAQWLLSRNESLRRAAFVLDWLEAEAAAKPLNKSFGGSHTVMSLLRRGEHHDAIRLAEGSGAAMIAGILKAATPIGAPEPWHARARTVPLFGEFKHSVDDSTRRPDNAHRTTMLQHLHEMLADWENGFDKAILAHVCGSEQLLVDSFSASASWQDVLWAKLRCIIVNAISYASLRFGGERGRSQYVNHLEQYLNVSDAQRWESCIDQKVRQTVLSCISANRHDPLCATLSYLFDEPHPTAVTRSPAGCASLMLMHMLSKDGLKSYRPPPQTVSNMVSAEVDEWCSLQGAWSSEKSKLLVSLSASVDDDSLRVSHLSKSANFASRVSGFEEAAFHQAVLTMFGNSAADSVSLQCAQGKPLPTLCRWVKNVSGSSVEAAGSAALLAFRATWNSQHRSLEYLSEASQLIEEWAASNQAAPAALAFWVAAGRTLTAAQLHSQVVTKLREIPESRATARHQVQTEIESAWAMVCEFALNRKLFAFDPVDGNAALLVITAVCDSSVEHIESCMHDQVGGTFTTSMRLVTAVSRKIERPRADEAAALLRAAQRVRLALSQRLHDERVRGSS